MAKFPYGNHSRLGVNSIGVEGAAAIADALHVNEVLKKLNLDGHQLDLPKLRGTDSVTSLDLSRKGLGPASAIVIASLVAGNEVLTTLNLCNNGIGVEGAKALASALRVNGVLAKLNLDGRELDLPKLRGTDPVTSLSLSRIRLGVPYVLGPASAIVIASLIAGNEVLTTLNLRYTGIGDEGAAAIAEALRGNGVLTELDLCYNDIGDEGAVALGEALRVNGVLKSIDLRHNRLGCLSSDARLRLL